jgi:DNA-binding IclR family transcriptional regulator
MAIRTRTPKATTKTAVKAADKPAAKTAAKGDRSQTVERALEVLAAFDDTHPELGIRELARMLQMDRTVVYRIVATLEERRFLEQNPATRRYRIGQMAFVTGQYYVRSNPMFNAAVPRLQAVATAHNVNAFLATLHDDSVLYMTSIQLREPITFLLPAGSRGRLHTTSLGKVLLAGLHDVEVEQILRRIRMVALTPRSQVSIKGLMTEVRQVRRQGYATSRDTMVMGLASVGAPVRDGNGAVVAAISLSLPSDEADDALMRKLTRAALQCAQQISLAAGAAIDGFVDAA